MQRLIAHKEVFLYEQSTRPEFYILFNMFKNKREMLPQAPIKVQRERLNQFIAILTPVTEDKRLTAKRELKPDRAEIKNVLKKCFEHIITIRVIITITEIMAIINFAYSGIIAFSVCTEYFSARMKLVRSCCF